MGSEARARLGLIGLIAATLFAFNQLFANGDYPGPAILGILIAAGIAIGARRLGVSSGLTFVISGLTLLWYLTIVFEAKHTFYGLPTPDALRHLVDLVKKGYEHSSIDYAPVPVRPGYVVMIVVAMWAITTIAEVATFRWRRPLIASMPAVILFAFVMVVGTGVAASVLVPVFLAALFTYWGLESAHRLRSWGRWVATFQGADEDDEPISVTGTLARTMGATCVVVALVAPLFLPVLGEGLLDWRNDVGAGESGGVGGGGTTTIDPLVSIVPNLITQTDKQLFTVVADRPAYWRLVTLTDFDGQTWRPSSEPDTRAGAGSIATDLPPPSPGKIVNQTYTMSGLGGTAMPAAVVPTVVTLNGSNAEDLRDNVEFDRETGDLELTSQLVDNFSYTITSIVPDTSYENMLDAAPSNPVLDQRYLALPPISERVRNLAIRWTSGPETDFKKLLALQSRLRRFTYSLDVERSASTDYLEQFLFETKTGYCQQFATAFAVLARSLGYPTRVSVGFLPGSSQPEEPTRFAVFGTDAHAWPEVYFENLGWVAFEPTPRTEAPPPAYTEAPIAGGTGGLTRPDETLNAVDKNRNAAERDATFRRGGGDNGNVPTPGPQRTPAWQKTFTRILIVTAIAVIAFLIAVPMIKEWRIRRRYARAKDARSRAVAAFAEFQDQAGELVTPRRVSESASAYAERVTSSRKLRREPARRLASLYEAAEYAPVAISTQQGNEARRLARHLRSSLWKESSWWDRAERLFSPATIKLPTVRIPRPNGSPSARPSGRSASRF